MLKEQCSYLCERWIKDPEWRGHSSVVLSVVERFGVELKGLDGEIDYQDRVIMPKSFHKPYQLLCEKGYVNMSLPEPYGVNAPWVLHHMVWERLASYHLSLTTLPMLGFGVIGTLLAYGDKTLEPYLPLLASGQCGATMCLTEPQCGSDLSLIQTKAKPNDSGFSITGHKIWITYGDHDLTENILHLVLARTAEGGTKGLSLFLVPKLLNGRVNGVYCHGLVKTMGQALTPTCMMEFNQAQGFLVGTLNQGMEAIFSMMNPARMGVGVQALGLSQSAFQKAQQFSKMRRSIQYQGQRMSIEHIPDVNRMLKGIEVTQYAMRLLVSYTSYHLDQGNQAIAGLLIPMLKTYVTEQSLENISTSMQVMGGLGYLEIGQCERLYRDARVTLIYEGTSGVQAGDLLFRKVLKDKGRTLQVLLAELGPDAHYQELEAVHKAMQSMSQQDLAFIASDYLQYLVLIVLFRLIDQDGYLTNDLKGFFKSYIFPKSIMYRERLLKRENKVLEST